MRKWLVISSFTVLGVASAFQVFTATAFRHESSLKGKKLADLLPGKDSGWTFKEGAMGASEAAEGRVQDILKYDDAVVRTYEKDGLKISVYAAYWAPAKVPYSVCGVHNPDSCWVLNGMKREDRQYAVSKKAGPLALKPFEYGKYSKDGRNTETIWWHLVGGEPNRYEQQSAGWVYGLAGKVERTGLLVRDLGKHGLDGQKEQFFVRLTPESPIPFGELWDDPRFQDLLKRLEPLGILAK